MSKLFVAAAQIECRPGDVAANLALHLEAIGRARGKGIDLLVFPELSLTDYLVAPDCEVLALGTSDAVFADLAAAAGPMLVSAGFVERAADGFFNTQALVDGSGVVHLHRKLNLPGYGNLVETRFYRPGDRLEPARAFGRSIATLICADAWNPALPWAAALAGADLLALPAASARGAVGGDFDNPAGWAVVLAHTTLVYGLPTIFANHCGSRGGLDFWGGSRILDADGRILAQAGETAAVVVAEIDTALTHRRRALLPTVRDGDPALIARLLHTLGGRC